MGVWRRRGPFSDDWNVKRCARPGVLADSAYRTPAVGLLWRFLRYVFEAGPPACLDVPKFKSLPLCAPSRSASSAISVFGVRYFLTAFWGCVWCASVQILAYNFIVGFLCRHCLPAGSSWGCSAAFFALHKMCRVTGLCNTTVCLVVWACM